MNDEQLRRCIVEELRKAQEPLSEEQLFERCGVVKSTQHSIESFRAFISQQCSHDVKTVQNSGDENSLPKYALHVECVRKTGTLNARTARSKSRSSSRGATPDLVPMRFNPATDGYPVLKHIVQRFASNSKDGKINWNVIRSQYRKETGRHLNSEELNAICGTVNMTRHDLLANHLSKMVEMLDSRGQIVKLAASFSPETESPCSSSHSSPEGDKQCQPSVPLNVIQDSRRQLIIEQLKRSGVILDENGRAVTVGHRSLTNDNVGHADGDNTKACSGDTLMASESVQTSFYSVNQFLETSGEAGYATGYDASPESDASLDITNDRSVWESTPRRAHEITLRYVEALEMHREEHVVKTRNGSTSKDGYFDDKQDVDEQCCKRGSGDHIHVEKICYRKISERSRKNWIGDRVANGSGEYYGSDSALNGLHGSEDYHFVCNSGTSIGTDDVFEENSTSFLEKPSENSEERGEKVDLGQEPTTVIEKTPVKESVALSGGRNHEAEGHVHTGDAVLPEGREAGSPKEPLEKCERLLEMEVKTKDCSEHDNLEENSSDTSSPYSGSDGGIGMDPIPRGIHVVHKIRTFQNERRCSLPVNLKEAEISAIEKRGRIPSSYPSAEIVYKKTNLKNPKTVKGPACIVEMSCPELSMESMSTAVVEDYVNDAEELRTSETFSSMDVEFSTGDNTEEKVVLKSQHFLNPFFLRRRITNCCSIL